MISTFLHLFESFGSDYQRVIPRDFFNESKIYSLISILAQWQNKGVLSDSLVLYFEDDVEPGLSEDGDMFLQGFYADFEDKPVEFRMPYNAGKESKYPLYFSCHSKDIWLEPVFSDDGSMSPEFSSVFRGNGASRNQAEKPLRLRAEFLKLMGVVGLNYLEGKLREDFVLDIEDGGFGVKIYTNRVNASNLISYLGDEAVFFYMTRNGVLRVDDGTEDFEVFSSERVISEKFKHKFGYQSKYTDQ